MTVYLERQDHQNVIDREDLLIFAFMAPFHLFEEKRDFQNQFGSNLI